MRDVYLLCDLIAATETTDWQCFDQNRTPAQQRSDRFARWFWMALRFVLWSAIHGLSITSNYPLGALITNWRVVDEERSTEPSKGKDRRTDKTPELTTTILAQMISASLSISFLFHVVLVSVFLFLPSLWYVVHNIPCVGLKRYLFM